MESSINSKIITNIDFRIIISKLSSPVAIGNGGRLIVSPTIFSSIPPAKHFLR